MLLVGALSAQTNKIDTTNQPLNSAQNVLNNNSGKKFTIGGYGQIDYNQGYNDTARTNGKLDVHRMVIFMGYKFNDRVDFVTEVEFEHVKEVYVEQAFMNYRINQAFNLKAGLMLIPMGIQNEYHEPTTFNGVERTKVESDLVPTTWRELGLGFTGTLDGVSLKYQLYAVNGLLGYDGGGKFKGSNGFRKGRQKGAESTISSPNLSAKVDFYGIKGLKIGLAGYYGNTQSTLYDGLMHNDTTGLAEQADSSVVGMAMVGFDVRYTYKAFQARGQVISTTVSNTAEYNAFTGKDLGSSMIGYYGELGYDVLSIFKKDAKEKIVLFGRYEAWDTHASVASDMEKNDAYNRSAITTGITYHVAKGAAFKADYQIFNNDAEGSMPSNQFNMGVAVWF
ncbi:MAG: hypothetical protein COB15_16865 [Flavobacteriales bacterium]|nr:MAG: hypothetical protein COB15_16865 [Flavobacteriales bacterium]